VQSPNLIENIFMHLATTPQAKTYAFNILQSAREAK